MKYRPIIYAHRGASAYRPENTMLAFYYAFRLGAKALEADIQMTRDEKLVVIHDETLERTTNGRGWVKDYNLRELKLLDAGCWMAQQFCGEKIPELFELLNFIRAKNILLNIEIKSDVISYTGIEIALLRQVKKLELQEQIIISSFNHSSIGRVREMNSNIKTALLFAGKEDYIISKCRYFGVDYAHLRCDTFQYINPLLFKQANLGVCCYTVNNEEEMLALFKKKIDGIFTDVPNEALKLLL